jgi:hypothetical protein
MNRKIPAYRLRKPTGQAVVRLDGRDHYLGKHDTPASREKYRRTIAEWLSSGSHPEPRHVPQATASRPTVNELLLAFWRHAETYYRKPDGTPTAEPDKIKLEVRPLKRLYGMTLAEDFGPKSLKALRDSMVADGMCRRTANPRIGIVVRVFRHAVENEMIPPPSIRHSRPSRGSRRAVRTPRRARPSPPSPRPRSRPSGVVDDRTTTADGDAVGRSEDHAIGRPGPDGRGLGLNAIPIR